MRLLAGFALAAAGGYAAPAGADIILPDNYHAQITQNFCAAASVEMILDTPQITNNAGLTNTNFVNLLASIGGGDGPTTAFIPPGTQPIAEPVAGTQNGNVISGGPQAFIYGLNHGNNTVNGLGYLNYYAPFGVGTDSLGMVTALNLLDNSNVNAGIPNLPFGNDQFVGFNLPAALGSRNLQLASNATRTMAEAMANTNIPCQATINSGAHSICVYGVTTNGQPAQNQNYAITGVLVHDPWTGYVVSRIAAGDPAFQNLTTSSTSPAWGLGYNTWLRYGYDSPGIYSSGYPVTLPNGNVQNVVVRGWLNYFNPSGGQQFLLPNIQTNAYTNVYANSGLNANATNFTLPGYKFTVEPQGPEALDTGDPAQDGSLPAPPSLLGSEENAGQADSAAMSDLAANSGLSSEPGLTGGSLDSAHEILMQMPGDVSGQGDWLVPYDGSGGINDVTGAIMIDADTGVIDQATWIDPSQNESPFSFAQIDQMFADEAAGDTPNDNVAPEPGTNALLAVAAVGLLAYQVWRRRQGHYNFSPQ